MRITQGVMASSRRFFMGILAVVVLLFGLACLNYTQATGIEHHRAWAAEHGMPGPTQTIFYAGAAATALGGIAFGVALAKRRG